MEMGVGAEALDPAHDGRARHPALAEERDDRLVERLAVVVVGLADVDPDEQRRALDAHQIARPMARPGRDRDEPDRRSSRRGWRSPAPYEPLSMRPHDSSM